MWEWISRIFPRDSPAPAPREEPARPVDAAAPLLDELQQLGGAGRAHAAARLRERVDALPMSCRVQLDEMMRRRLSSYDRQSTLPWLRGPDDARRLVLPAGTEGAVLGLLSSAPNGYVREAVVQRLALVGSGDELPPLLLRANDWVAPVRDRAMHALRARLVPAYAPYWIRTLRLVLRLQQTERGDTRPLVEAVLALLHGDDVRQAVVDGLYAPDRVAARACFTILLRTGAPELEDVVLRGLGSDDVGIRLEAARAAARLDDLALADVLPRIMNDPFVRVRMAGAEIAAERTGLEVLPALTAALMDRGSAVRARARAVMARVQPMDFAAFYRVETTSDGPRLAEAVAGLGETGRAEDAAAVLPLVAHDRVRVRATAVRALDRLAGDAHPDVFTVSLGSSYPSVSRAAADALRRRVRLVSAASIEVSLHPGAPVHVRRNALALLVARGKWDGLPWILRALVDEDPRIQRAAAEHLYRWRAQFNRTFTQPTAEQVARTRAALEPVADTLPPETVRWLRFAAGIGR